MNREAALRKTEEVFHTSSVFVVHRLLERKLTVVVYYSLALGLVCADISCMCRKDSICILV